MYGGGCAEVLAAVWAFRYQALASSGEALLLILFETRRKAFQLMQIHVCMSTLLFLVHLRIASDQTIAPIALQLTTTSRPSA
jgi:hypothetical protein